MTVAQALIRLALCAYWMGSGAILFIAGVECIANASAFINTREVQIVGGLLMAIGALCQVIGPVLATARR
jgi:hypothetical protein